MTIMSLRTITAGSLVVAAVVATAPARADGEGLVVKPSAHGVIETVDRLERVLSEKGITVMARFDHAESALKADAELRPTELLVFGNPSLGTPLMQSQPTTGIDLPMKALVYEDQDGRVWLAYNDPAWLAARHSITGHDEIIQKMSGTLDQLTDTATQE
jgi:uncharacterized protein (DUF302 family)